MKTEWDYSALAEAYLERPDYADAAIDAMLAVARVEKPQKVCDVGAGVAHLTLMLAARGLNVTAVEPNDAMRANGIKRTASLKNVSWFEGTGEQTGQPDKSFNMVTFGSSFNVCNRDEAMRETVRILSPRGWFACMWNHRDLDDSIQKRIEDIIRSNIADYSYGTRRESPQEVIESSNLFGPVVHISARVIHTQSIAGCVEAWRSHATLARQAGPAFPTIVASIQEYLSSLGRDRIEIPYATNIWVAQARSA